MTNDVLENAGNHFENLVKEQLERVEKMKEAEDVVDKVLERDKGHVTANFLKGRLYLLKRDFASGLERFELARRCAYGLRGRQSRGIRSQHQRLGHHSRRYRITG